MMTKENNTSSFNNMIKWLKREVKPALGCTEPIAIAFAAATAAQHRLGEIVRIEGEISNNLYKNANGVMIPGVDGCGVELAAAIGAIGGDTSLGLEVLKNITPFQVEQAKALVEQSAVTLRHVDSENFIYVDLTLYSADNKCRVIIQEQHINVTDIFVDDIALPLEKSVSEQSDEGHLTTFSVEEAFQFINEVNWQDIAFMEEAVRLNSALSDLGKSRPYGLNVNGTLRQAIADGFASDDLINKIVIDATAASDARMGGASAPAMSNYGSGNQGITATMPVVTMAQFLGSEREEMVRAVTLSHLVAISIHSRYTRLSALCAVTTAAMGSAAGIVWLLTKDYTIASNAIKNMIGDISGIMCDGASNSCALKVSTAVSCTIKSALLAKNNHVVSSKDGIVSQDIEQSINDLCQLVLSPMQQVDKQIIQIVSDKAYTLSMSSCG
ncbi:MAG: serine dehydratase subunit alpha family protein [Enterobacteriaceae bacterium]